VLMPAFFNAHAHANRAFCASGRRPVSLEDAVARVAQERSTLGKDDYRERARRMFDCAVVHGTARIRTHTDIDPVTGLRAIEGVLEAARDFEGVLDVEVVAFAHAGADPVRTDVQHLLQDAVAIGAGWIGAAPALCASPSATIDGVLKLAARLGAEVDLHLDEHLDAVDSQLAPVIARTVEFGLRGRVTVSHGCALAVMSEVDARRRLDAMAEARIALAALPELNLYLQGRGSRMPGPRGIAPLKLARAAGVDVRLGTDNVRDWFFPFGDGDPLTAGYVAAIGAHCDLATDLVAALCGGRSALAEGDPADLVLVPAGSFDEALAVRPEGRELFRSGRRVRRRSSS